MFDFFKGAPKLSAHDFNMKYDQAYYEQQIEQQQSAQAAEWMTNNKDMYLGAPKKLGIPSNIPMLKTKQGTGAFADGVDPMQSHLMQRNFAMGASGVPQISQQGFDNSASMQGNIMSGVNSLDLEKWKHKNIAKEAKSPYSDVKVDEAGNAWGLKKATGQYEQIPGGGQFPIPGQKIEVNVGGEAVPPYDIEKGYMLADQNDWSKGVTPIPGGGKDKVSVGDASKISQFQTAKSLIPQIQEKLFQKDDDGGFSTDNLNVFNADFNTPFTDGRTLNSMYENGIQAITRGETGAAMPPEEVKNTRRRFQPNSLDNEETKLIKWQLFQEFLGGTLKLIDPSGRFDEARFQAELTRRQSSDVNGGGWSIEEID